MANRRLNKSDLEFQREDGTWVFVWFYPLIPEVELGVVAKDRVEFIRFNRTGVEKRETTMLDYALSLLDEARSVFPDEFEQNFFKPVRRVIKSDQRKINALQKELDALTTFFKKIEDKVK